MTEFTLLDAAVLVAYLVGVTALGLRLGGKQESTEDYFLGGRSIPWWAICFSVVATETSALTFISIPAVSYQGDFWILQLAFGYLLGRIAVAALLLPGYFRGDYSTAYALLGERFGLATRRFASSTFMVTRALADSVRVFAAAIPLALITGWPYWLAILVMGAVTLIYTYIGGLRAVVWVDVAQMALYAVGGVIAVVVLAQVVPGGWEGIFTGLPEGKLDIFHWGGGFGDATWFLTGIVGGAFLSMASHGADYLVVQRLLAAPSLRDAKKAVVTSAGIVILQFALFLVIGIGLYAFYEGRAFDTPDAIFPTFIIEQLPPGVSGLIVAGILAAAMSTVSSSLNSLAGATTHDLYAPLARAGHEPDRLLRAGRRFTLLWAGILVGGAILFRLVSQGTPVVVIALQIASFTYGGLLGGFLLGLFSKRARQRDAILGMAVAIGLMTLLWAVQQFGAVPTLVDPLWFSLIGSLVTILVGLTAAGSRGSGSFTAEGAESAEERRRWEWQEGAAERELFGGGPG